MKTASRIVPAVALIIVILAVAVFFFANTLIRRGVEEVGGRSLGVEVKLARAKLSIFRGRLALINLRVSNPDGFRTDRLFEVTGARTKMRPVALFRDELVVDRIVLESPSLTIEQSARGTNMELVLANIQHEEAGEEKPEKQKSYRIKTLQINGAKVTFASFLTAKAPITVPLPDIQIENISNADGTGLTLAQVFQKVFVKMIETSLRTGKGIIPAEIRTDVKGQLTEFAPELALGVGEKTKGVIDKTGEKLRGLFKR